MDWIRLGSSGKDLTGVGSRAGQLEVTPAELATHNKSSDAWMALRGRVYNVTAYLPFHPGGPEELMKGVGRDATNLFEEVHPWVNYESILQKCYIGPLVSASPSVDVKQLFNSSKTPENKKPVDVQASNSKNPVPEIEIAGPSPEKEEEPVALPKFDWIQKMNDISVFFYTPPLANPLVEVHRVDDVVHVTLCYSNRTFNNELVFSKGTEWPCVVKVNFETGKIECAFKKTKGNVWSNYGVLKQSSKLAGSFSAKNKIGYVVTNKMPVSSNVFLIELGRVDGVLIVMPIANHVRVFAETKDKDFSKSYTPIPSGLFTQLGYQKISTDKLYLMVKRYQDGNMSKYICDAIKGDILLLSKPFFSLLKLSDLEKKENFLLLAAGSGITPMLSILLFLLERRVRKSQSIRLIFCNRKLNHIPCKQQFDNLSTSDSRFKVEHILSDPDNNWRGRTGRITKEIIKSTIEEQLSSANYPKLDLYAFVCGPSGFNQACFDYLTELDIYKEQITVFEG
ncbi:hypothetical protein WA026_000050 [Henosepilachna vigintioctopunctata]